MSENFDKFVKKLQKEIIKKDIEDHNEKIVNLFHNPQNWGKPPKKDITVSEEYRGGPRNYFLGLYLKIEDDVIAKANFITDGCGVMVATASQTTLLIEGRSLEFAESLKPENLDEALAGIPNNEKHCAELAIRTLKCAIQKYKK
ncbi:MAG: iron-sulfur cluster assembly scaffold protein [Promethearchaeota archaeon]